MKDREYEYVRGYSDIDPHACIARDISPKRPKIDPAEVEAEEAAERYKKWRDEIFGEHERTKRSASNSSARAKEEQKEMTNVGDKIKANQDQVTSAIDGIVNAADR